jgi:hypothetical protein
MSSARIHLSLTQAEYDCLIQMRRRCFANRGSDSFIAREAIRVAIAHFKRALEEGRI